MVQDSTRREVVFIDGNGTHRIEKVTRNGRKPYFLAQYLERDAHGKTYWTGYLDSIIDHSYSAAFNRIARSLKINIRASQSRHS